MIQTRHYKTMAVLKGATTHLFLATIAMTCLFPLFWMVRCSLMSNETVFLDKALIPAVIHFGNYAEVWEKGNFGSYFLNSIIYTTCVVAGIVIISSLAAFAFSRLHFPGKNLFF